MPGKTICKTVHQYSKVQVPRGDMEKLLQIARDYRTVKNEVYARYGGIGGLSKLYPGYTVQNEMTRSGLRQRLEMPAVYFYLAIFEALADIKGQWAGTKSKVRQSVRENEGFTADEKHYLRFLLKTGDIFCEILQQTTAEVPQEIRKKQEELAASVDIEKLHRYLCRQVRKYHASPHTEQESGFAVAERAYRYADHGIYISTKEKRKRIFIPLTDNNRYSSQLTVRLFPEEARVELLVPVASAVTGHEDYRNVIGVSTGMYTMLTTHQGNSYGSELGSMQGEYADWVRMQTTSYNRNRKDNPGRKKYDARKRRYEEQLHSYINQELNRFFRTEKPQRIYVAKLPRPQAGGKNPKINHAVSMWQRGYIRKRLELKCREQSVELVEVLGNGISRECSRCGAQGSRGDGLFRCEACGYTVEEKTNAAQNVWKRGEEGRVLNSRSFGKLDKNQAEEAGE